ncbi:response regulator transcription factor [Caldimonas tepidiphila]|uniref:response regulator transcription factor n=1 Tax=Caldimonas tepidiphila TaxID=2315841 RepID=UPI000E5A23C4|nr:response regulator transcription factor [Caldimonas tepidiphila]
MYTAVLEDDPDQLELMKLWLGAGGHEVCGFSRMATFLEALRKERFDLLVIDWKLPDGDGTEVLRWVRQHLGWEVPLLVVTSMEDEATTVAALREGADDYVVKPPKPRELLARVEALVRRSRAGAGAGLPVLRLGAYEVDVQRHRIALRGQPVALTQKEFDLAVYLFQNPGKLMSRDHLLDRIWGINAEVDTRTVDTHVSRLRKKLQFTEANGCKLLPAYGYGYRLERIDLAPRG